MNANNLINHDFPKDRLQFFFTFIAGYLSDSSISKKIPSSENQELLIICPLPGALRSGFGDDGIRNV